MAAKRRKRREGEGEGEGEGEVVCDGHDDDDGYDDGEDGGCGLVVIVVKEVRGKRTGREEKGMMVVSRISTLARRVLDEKDVVCARALAYMLLCCELILCGIIIAKVPCTVQEENLIT